MKSFFSSSDGLEMEVVMDMLAGAGIRYELRSDPRSQTDAQLYYHTQINDAEMFLRVYDLDSSNISTGNISPTGNSDGIYRGIINMPYAAQWKTIDTIKYQGRYITNNPPPMPDFYFDLR